MSYVAIINDNNNFAPSIFWSLCEFVGDYFIWTLVFFFGSYVPSEKYLGPKQSPSISHNDLKKDSAQLLLSNLAKGECGFQVDKLTWYL